MKFETMPVNKQEDDEENNNNNYGLARKALEDLNKTLESRNEVDLGQLTNKFRESKSKPQEAHKTKFNEYDEIIETKKDNISPEFEELKSKPQEAQKTKFNEFGEIIETNKEDNISPENKAEIKEAQPDPELIAKLSLFKEKFNPKAEVVYYPCCASDTSPSEAFPESKIIYADIDEKSMEALKNKGYEANIASALEFDPGKVDILVMMKPAISPEVPASHVNEGGYTLCNDYHRTASSLKEMEDYELKARIGKKPNKELEFDTQNLNEYWEQVETEEEFKNAPFSSGSVDYKGAALVVEKITGKTEDVMNEYKKIIQMAREQRREMNAEMISEKPEMEKYLGDTEKESVFMFNYQGRQFTIIANLPRKKGTVDDVFVFQKKEIVKDKLN